MGIEPKTLQLWANALSTETNRPGPTELSSTIKCFFLSFLKKYFLLIFLQRGRERDRELETSLGEKHRPAASCTPPTGDGDVPATKVHAIDWNQPGTPQSADRCSIHRFQLQSNVSISALKSCSHQPQGVTEPQTWKKSHRTGSSPDQLNQKL
uniref:Uncharacterized protein n=1 Tax=Pipistrellus kuhlii TaxID=59472 RepID=A0A7J7V638_PIPKU|nr:hypothetical protein mPipKuh1_008549 [Pipistrellus kuhlii]